MTRVLVCGGRDYADRAKVFATLDRLHARMPISVLIHGAARGADSLGAAWGEAVLGKDNVKPFPADWTRYGKRAGPLRNQQMIDEGKPDFVVAFPGDTGTADMVRRAKAAGIRGMMVTP